jgi:hypothetical protein
VIESTSNEIISFIDDDCISEPGWLAAVERGFCARKISGSSVDGSATSRRRVAPASTTITKPSITPSHEKGGGAMREALP